MKEAIEIAADLCRHFEGFSSKPYICPAGYWTIGYGSTYMPDGKAVSSSTAPITKEEADELLKYDLARFLKQTLALCPALAAHSPNRVAAILDFVYNLGPARLKSSTLRKRIQSERWEDVPAELRKWVFGGGKRLPGLVRRREAEAALI